EQNLGDTGCGTRNGRETKHRGDDRNDEERQSPRQHKKTSVTRSHLTGSPRTASALLPRLEAGTRDNSSGSGGAQCVRVLRTGEESFEQRGSLFRPLVMDHV